MPISRISTALVLVTLIFASIFFLSATATTVLFLAFVALGAAEWASLAGLDGPLERWLYAIVIAAFVTGTWWLSASGLFLDAMMLVGSAWWVIVAAWVVSFQLSGRPAFKNAAALGLFGAFVFAPALCAVARLLTLSPGYLLCLFAIVWSAHILAYFGGRRFGRRRLASRISPGKTWEGVASAGVGTLVLGLLLNLGLSIAPAGTVVLVVVVTLVAAIIGDLFESLIKRLRGVKDSGALLPGHGGVMDRIDSLVAAAPIYLFTLHTMGYA